MDTETDTIEKLSQSYKVGATSPTDVVAALVEKIHAENDYYGAYQAVWGDEAIEAAQIATKALKTGASYGPLHGVPFALKDIFHVKGKPTTCGSVEPVTKTANVTSIVVKRLVNAGAIILGKTKTVECAFGGWGTNQKMGTPRNPWDDDVHRIPGGSSSGSAVAVAANHAICAVGSDTGGSVRLPAAYCGLVGLKVTYGRLSNHGIMPLSQTLDSPGPITRTVRDAIIMFDVMDGRENWQVTQDYDEGLNNFYGLERGTVGLKVGCLSEDERQHCAAETLDAYDVVLNKLRRGGAIIETFRNPSPYGKLADINGAITAVEAYFNHGYLYEDEKREMDSDVRARMLSGKQHLAHEYFSMLQQRRLDIERFNYSMMGLDVLITPTTIGRAPSIDEVDQNIAPSYYTRPFNYLGMCAISIPTGLDDVGLPTSIQVVGRAHKEHSILQVGAAIEQVVLKF